MAKKVKILLPFLFFWIFLLLFKFGAGLQYALLSPLGARVMPLWLVGLVIFFASIFQLLLDIPAGKILDMFGYKRMLIVGTVATLVGVAVFFYGITTLSFVASVFLVAIGWLFFSPGINAYSLSYAEKRNSIHFMAYRDIFASMGIVLSCLLLPFIVDSSGKAISFILVPIIILALLSLLLVRDDRRKLKMATEPHERTHKQRSYVLNNFSLAIKRLNPASTLLIMLNCAGGIFYGVVWFVVPLIIASEVYNGLLLGAGLALFDFAVVIVGSFLCNMIQNNEKKRVIFAGLVLFCISGFLLGLSFGILFLVFAFLSTAGDEVASLPLWAWMHKLDKKHNKDGLVSGIINLFSDIGWAVGPLIAGITYYILGPTFAIAIGAIPIAVVLVIYHVTVRKHTLKVSILEAPRKPHKARHKG